MRKTGAVTLDINSISNICFDAFGNDIALEIISHGMGMDGWISPLAMPIAKGVFKNEN